ncbi:flavohemoglobin expression-modulating QEGLA motif protein, partial [Acidobacteriota bacterium]
MISPIKTGKTNLITSAFITEVCDRLAKNKQVRRALPMGGRLHIDRSLPFLFVYRRPVRKNDQGTDRFAAGEASYLVASSSIKLRKDISELVQSVVSCLSAEYGAFLIIEIWAGSNTSDLSESEVNLPCPYFQVRIPARQIPSETVESIDKGLKRIKILKQKAKVELKFNTRAWPDYATSLIPAAELKNKNIYMVGIRINPVYRNSETGDLYPFVLRKLHQGISRAIKLGLFTFSHNLTTHRPQNYQALGRRAVVKAVWEVDRKLAQISNTYDFLLNITPINIEQAWNKFKKNKFERLPSFYYRPIPVDPASLKKELYQIPIDNIEDPTLAFVFREKQIEIEQELSMLRDRGTKDFFYSSLQLFGDVDTVLEDLASKLLKQISPHSHEANGKERVNAVLFAQRASKEIAHYKTLLPDMSANVEIRNDVSGLMVSRGNLYIGQKLNIPASRVEALIQHEVGTHILTYYNGKAQPFQQLYTGLAGYNELQEGLAVLSEYLVGGLSLPRLRLLAARVHTTNSMIAGASFIEAFRELCNTYGFAQRIAFSVAARIYRSGGVTKDVVYLRGLEKIFSYLGEGGGLEPLFVGKISTWHIPIIKELTSRQVLKPAPLCPRYLDDVNVNV